MHQLRTLGHRRVGQCRRLQLPQRRPAQSPRHRHPAQVHRAARREPLGLPDLPRHLQAVGPLGLFRRRENRARLVQDGLRGLGSAQEDLVGRVPEEGLLRRLRREGPPAPEALLPLVRGREEEGRARAASAAGRISREIRPRAADPVGQDRVRLVEPRASGQRSRASGAQSLHPLGRRPSSWRNIRSS